MSDATQTESTTTPQPSDGGTPAAAPAAAGGTNLLGDAPPPAADGKPADGKPADGDGKPAADAKDGKDGKPADDGKPQGAPEKYEPFTLPEGVKLDDAMVGDIQAVAKELNLPQEAAQKLADLAARRTAASAEAMQTQIQEHLTQIGDQWAEQAKADKEFGGDKFDENLAVAKKAMDKFATPEFKTLLVSSKLGNHPEMLRAFYRVGKAISEDGFVPGKGGNAGAWKASDLYPNTPNMNP